MLNSIITWSLQHRFAVIALTFVLIGTGLLSLRGLDIDAFPDTTPVMVQVNAPAPALSPLEIEQQVTFPIEQALGGLPGLTEVRSVSKFGFAQLTSVFDDSTDLYLARQLVSERLQTVELPQGISRPELGPISTGLGEIFHYIITGNGRTLEELTTIHNWMIKPQLRSLPGVAEVNTWGGEVKQYHVLIDPHQLMQRGLTVDDVASALRRNNLSVGGGNIVQGGELQVIRGISLTTTTEQIGDIVIASPDRVPIRIRDVAAVEIGHEIRRGATTANGTGEVVMGLAFMLTGNNSHDVSQRLARKVEEIRRSLPSGVDIKPVYQRTELVTQVLHTVRENLVIGALLVVAVLFTLLGNLRAGLIVAVAIPLSMLFAANMMLQVGIAASLMSLGAIDFGLIVDSSVIMVENSARRLALPAEGRSKLDIVREASIEVRKPTMFGELIIMIVYLPILTLEGIEGKMFRPMALTVVFALLGSLILSLTLMPVLASLVLNQGHSGVHRETFVIRMIQHVYRPMVRFAIEARHFVIIMAIMLLGGATWLATRLGTEFIPRLSEGAITINTIRLAGVSLEESIRYGTQLEQLIIDMFPDEVRDVWTRTGTAEISTDPMGIEVSDVFITLHPRNQWTRATSQDDLVHRLDEALSLMPGMRIVFSQPIEMRMNEMIAGVRADVGVKIFGDDLEALKSAATQVQGLLEQIPGSADIFVEQLTGQPVLEIVVDQQAIARYGISASHALEIIEAIGGTTVSEVREADGSQRRFDLVIKLAEPYRRDAAAIADTLVPTATGERIALRQIAVIRETEGPATITREWQKRRIIVQCNVRGRDLGSFVNDVQHAVQSQIQLPPGYYITYGGQFEHLQRAQMRLTIIVPMAVLLVIALLYLSTRSIGDALIILTGAPFAAIGGILALWLRDMPFTISAGVGFVAVTGVSMLNGLVLMSTINQRMRAGQTLEHAIEDTRLIRLRPILMTALVAALGFVPMALNTHIGAEVQRPLATVVIAGVIADNVLTLLVFPALLATFKKPPREAE